MKVARLFVAGLPEPPRPGEIRGAGVGDGQAQGAFITPQSLASFGGASFVVSVVTKVVEAVFRVGGPPVTFATALGVGAMIYLITIREPAARPSNGIDWAISIGVALLNSIVLAATALGLLKIAGVNSNDTPPG